MTNKHSLTVNYAIVRFVSLHCYSAFLAAACWCLQFLTPLGENKHLSHRWKSVTALRHHRRFNRPTAPPPGQSGSKPTVERSLKSRNRFCSSNGTVVRDGPLAQFTNVFHAMKSGFCVELLSTCCFQMSPLPESARLTHAPTL